MAITELIDWCHWYLLKCISCKLVLFTITAQIFLTLMINKKLSIRINFWLALQTCEPLCKVNTYQLDCRQVVLNSGPPLRRPPLLQWKNGHTRGWSLLSGDSLVAFYYLWSVITSEIWPDDQIWEVAFGGSGPFKEGLQYLHINVCNISGLIPDMSIFDLVTFNNWSSTSRISFVIICDMFVLFCSKDDFNSRIIIFLNSVFSTKSAEN